MDFFAKQRHHSRRSRALYGLFFVVMTVQAVMLLMVAGVVAYVWTGSLGVSVFLGSSLGVGVYFATGLLIARHKIKKGGLSLAGSVHAVRLFIHDDGQDDTIFTKTYIKAPSLRHLPSHYRRYHEFAEQMAIASGVPLPKLYVLPFEMGVNAFVAGFGVSDTVMVLTEGATQKLSNDELYALIGHEFGHLICNDHELNLRMYVMMSMFGWVYDLADAMEEYLLGRFDKDYHGDDVVLDGSQKSWVDYLKNTQRHLSHRQFGDDARATLFLPYLIMITPVVLFRLFGVLGMMLGEWVRGRFNHEREYLADAISIQLTRSDGVVYALQSLMRHDSVLHDPALTTSMSHFFFASPKPMDSHSLSHPPLYDRQQVVARAMPVISLDTATKERLDNARRFCQSYHFKSNQEPLTSDKPALDDRHPLLKNATINDSGQTVVSYDGWQDVVIDGKLMADGWYEQDRQLFYPQSAPTNETLTARHGHLVPSDLNHAQLPYAITSALRETLSVMAVLECVLCCRFFEQVGGQVDLRAIYWGRCSDGVKPVLPHNLPNGLLKSVARYDRQADGLLIYLALKRLCELDEPLSDNDDKLLSIYTKTLSSLITSSDIRHRVGGLAVMYRGVLLAVLLSILQKRHDGDITHTYDDVKAYLGGDVSPFVVVLAQVASGQDNSLIMGRHDKITTSIRRWARLAGVAVSLNDDELIGLCHRAGHLSVSDWVVVLMSIDGNRAFVETLITAFLYDGQTSQDEHELMWLLSLLWGVVIDWQA
ncbi:MAG: M48 family metalloprotease [Moraxella sp.]|nr:M48 family metalloprotease [Moraxella sp.]